MAYLGKLKNGNFCLLGRFCDDLGEHYFRFGDEDFPTDGKAIAFANSMDVGVYEEPIIPIV